jgi:oxaloacetate decarboxylase alpha subunit
VKPLGIFDETLRDAQQSLWATRMTTAMMLPIAPVMDRIGFEAIDLVGGAVFDVCVRYLREDPWERMRLVSRVIRRTPLVMMVRGQSLFTFELFPDDVVELTARRAAANGIRYTTPYDAMNDIRNLEVYAKAAKQAGLYVAAGLVYSLSPVHTDAYYERKARDLLGLGVDAVFLKDPSGLLTPERTRSLVPVLLGVLGEIPLHLHSHCLTGLAPLCHLEAMRLGVATVCTASSPLAHGPSHPPTEFVVAQAGRMGREVSLDRGGLKQLADYFAWVAKREGKPIGRPVEYDPWHYQHQVPGGMITNLRSQLRDLGLEGRLEAILEEAVRVRQELGYPIMVSPLSQYVATQAALNVLQGERYRTVPDEVRRYALGYYGELAAPIDPDVLDRATGGRAPVTGRAGERLPPILDKVRAERGPFASDDDLLLAVFYNRETFADLMAARPIKTDYPGAPTPLATLLKELAARPDLAYVDVRKGAFRLTQTFQPRGR